MQAQPAPTANKPCMKRLMLAALCLVSLVAAGVRPAHGRGVQETPMKKLNNLVAELLSVRRGQPNADAEYGFTNPRAGWVFIAAKAKAPSGGALRVTLTSGAAAHEILASAPGSPGPLEAMRFLPAGSHKLAVRCQGNAALQSLTVRAIPELIFCKFGAGVHVTEYGPYDWDFLAKDVIPNVNTMVGGGAQADRPYIERWKSWGRRWLIECGVPGLSAEKGPTADEAERYWAGNPGMQDPLLDGVIADEFFNSDDDKYLAWTEAVRRIARDPQFKGKAFYPYCGGSLFESTRSRHFIRTVIKAGWPVSWERYLSEEATEAEARAALREHLCDEMRAWRKAQPGIEKHTVVCLGYLSAPPESLDTHPNADYKVWMDMQFNTLANDPAFEDLYGVMEYLSSYADEEYLRWAGRLYRHYCIEGRVTPLTRDPYILPHLQNGDFDHGLEGWTVAAAEPASVAAKSMEGYSWLQARYPQTRQGDTFLWMKRSAARPNVVSQTIHGLTPGRLYSIRMFTGDYRDLSVQQKHAVSLRIEGVEEVGAPLQHVYANCYSHKLGSYDADHHAWMNFHRRIFRANGPTAELTITDWATDREPGGPIGQELMLNFVQVQPYLGG
jgi:hypothetical protein